MTWLFLIEYNNQTKTSHSSHTETYNSVRSQTLMIGNSGPPGQYTIGSTYIAWWGISNHINTKSTKFI